MEKKNYVQFYFLTKPPLYFKISRFNLYGQKTQSRMTPTQVYNDQMKPMQMPLKHKSQHNSKNMPIHREIMFTLLSNKLKLLSVSLWIALCSPQWNAELFFFCFYFILFFVLSLDVFFFLFFFCFLSCPPPPFFSFFFFFFFCFLCLSGFFSFFFVFFLLIIFLV